MIVTAINSYIWQLLQRDNGWAKINNITPIVPSQQQPELMNSPLPHAVYVSSLDFNSGNLEPVDAEVIHYLIYANDMNIINDSIGTIKNAFKAFYSAQNINGWINNSLSALDSRDKYIVTYTEVMDALTANPSSTEGGKYDGYISIRVGYHTTPINYAV